MKFLKYTGISWQKIPFVSKQNFDLQERKEADTMVTCSDLFTFVIMPRSAITLIIATFRHKK